MSRRRHIANTLHPGLLKPNSIMLAGSKLVRRWSQTGSKLVGDQLWTCLRPASNQLS